VGAGTQKKFMLVPNLMANIVSGASFLCDSPEMTLSEAQRSEGHINLYIPHVH
jgi:hypothetical protein